LFDRNGSVKIKIKYLWQIGIIAFVMIWTAALISRLPEALHRRLAGQGDGRTLPLEQILEWFLEMV
jgi:hypothetical protein